MFSRHPPPYPHASAPGVHVVLTPTPSGYGDRIVIATTSRHKAASAWRDTAESGVVTAQVWHGDRVEYAEWSRHTGLRQWRST